MEIGGRPSRQPRRFVSVAALCADLSQPESAGVLIQSMLERFGVIDILVNNAGTITRHDAVEYPISRICPLL